MGVTRVVEVVVAVLGIILSAYALYVESRISEDPEFEALCDISDEMKCSEVFTSEYGHIFGKIGLVPKGSILDLPNAAYGVVFYTLFVLRPLVEVLLGKSGSKAAFFVISAFALALSVALFYVLRYIMNDMCVLCISTYFLNGVLAVISVRDVLLTGRPEAQKKDA